MRSTITTEWPREGVRCDIAMLILLEVFERTWVRRPGSFRPLAFQNPRENHPDFPFMAEVFWIWNGLFNGRFFITGTASASSMAGRAGRPVRDYFRADLDLQMNLAGAKIVDLL